MTNLRKKFNLLLASCKKQGYTTLKYIESSGTQYIDTGWSPQSNNLKIRFRATSVGAPQGTAICGAEDWRVRPRWVFILFGQSADATKVFPLIGDWNNKTDGFTFTSGTTIDIEWSANSTSTKVTENITNTTYTYTYESTMNFQNNDTTLKIFQNADGQRSSIRLSSYQIIDNNVLVRDFIPVLDKNGTPCMLDRVENKLYYNQGTGDFAYEEWDFTPCDYVYADGNAYTSTLWHGDSDTKMEMVFDIATQASANTGSMGSRISANSQLLAIGYGASALASDFNNSSWSPYRAAIVYETNKKYRVYTSKEKRSIIDEETGTVLAENNTLCSDTLSTDVLLLGAETGVALRHVGNIYEAKVWDGNVLMRDFVPVVDENNVAGFYDKCLNVIFYSIGTSPYEAHFVDGNNDYKVVHFLECTATPEGPYIDTGVPYFADFEVGVQVRSNVSNKVILSGQYYCLERNNEATGVYRFTNSPDYKLITNALITQYHVIKWKDNKTYIDGVFFADFNKTAQTGANLTIFGYLNSKQKPACYPSVVRFVKVWNPSNGELLMHLIPVVKNNVGYMFDVKNRVLYPNAGVGTFVYE